MHRHRRVRLRCLGLVFFLATDTICMAQAAHAEGCRKLVRIFVDVSESMTRAPVAPAPLAVALTAIERLLGANAANGKPLLADEDVVEVYAFAEKVVRLWPDRELHRGSLELGELVQEYQDRIVKADLQETNLIGILEYLSWLKAPSPGFDREISLVVSDFLFDLGLLSPIPNKKWEEKFAEELRLRRYSLTQNYGTSPLAHLVLLKLEGGSVRRPPGAPRPVLVWKYFAELTEEPSAFNDFTLDKQMSLNAEVERVLSYPLSLAVRGDASGERVITLKNESRCERVALAATEIVCGQSHVQIYPARALDPGEALPDHRWMPEGIHSSCQVSAFGMANTPVATTRFEAVDSRKELLASYCEVEPYRPNRVTYYALLRGQISQPARVWLTIDQGQRTGDFVIDPSRLSSTPSEFSRTEERGVYPAFCDASHPVTLHLDGGQLEPPASRGDGTASNVAVAVPSESRAELPLSLIIFALTLAVTGHWFLALEIGHGAGKIVEDLIKLLPGAALGYGSIATKPQVDSWASHHPEGILVAAVSVGILVHGALGACSSLWLARAAGGGIASAQGDSATAGGSWLDGIRKGQGAVVRQRRIGTLRPLAALLAMALCALYLNHVRVSSDRQGQDGGHITVAQPPKSE
jgi:hypothetical protein